MPDTTAQLFTARDYFDDVAGRRRRRAEGPTAREHNEDHLGAGFLFVMLAERIDPATAMAAVDGWRGDAYRSASSSDPDGGERICVAARIRTASSEDGTELRDALGTWSESMPAEADVEVAARGARGRRCGRAIPGPTPTMALTGQVGSTRSCTRWCATSWPPARSSAGMDRDAALCVAEVVLPELTPEELSAEELTDELQSKLTDADRRRRSSLLSRARRSSAQVEDDERRRSGRACG